MKCAPRNLAYFFLILCSLWMVPAGLIHELTAHEDTHDLCLPAGPGEFIGTEHHHCETLQLSVPPLIPFAPTFAFLLSAEITSHPFFREVRSTCATGEAFLFFRGPPLA